MAEGVQDLATLAKLDEKVLLQELKKRFTKDQIYTYVGDILVAVNPFKSLDIYGSKFSAMYKKSARKERPPHIFAVADSAFQAMEGRKGSKAKNQCILISGESGAGKTESTKLIIKQLIETCKGNTQLEQQILQVNPLLEAFGNARTTMNDNSSRFGKFIQLKFSKGQVLGAKISEYLLEKSRVVQQGSGEQNFHIFNYMFAMVEKNDQNRYRMQSAKDYRYLSDGGATWSKNKEKCSAMYDDVINAMDMVGFTDEEKDRMFRIISSVLNMGNINIECDENNFALIRDENKAMSTSSNLAGIDSEELDGCLTSSVTFTRGEKIVRQYTKEQAEESRDAVSKTLYGRLFSWIVNKINTLLAPKSLSDQDKEIGILDIFGFEHFDVNSFEQVCINLANEQLQYFFNRHVFSLEQEEYKREGVDWKEIKFKDNKALLDLYLGRPIGLMALLDEESLFPKGTDLSFVEKLTMRFDHDPSYIKPTSAKSPTFTIVHYAGKVEYNSKGWLVKNRDTLPPGVMEMLQQSTNPLIKLIFNGKISRTGTLALHLKSSRVRKSRQAQHAAKKARERKVTVGGQFKNSLQVLMERMLESQPIFIRCIKPSHDKIPGKFDDIYVNEQLLYTGMLETTKIRREGFAVRPTFADFVERYQILGKKANLPLTSDSAKHILQKCGLKGWQMGKTKVFLKYYHTDHLAAEMGRLAQYAVVVQSHVRGFLARRRVMRLWKVSQKEEDIVIDCLKYANQLMVYNLQLQKDACRQDKDIPKDLLIEKKEDPLAPQQPATQPVPSKSKVSFKEVSIGTDTPSPSSDMESDSGSDVSEDEFVPVKTAQKFGEAGTRQASKRWFQQTQMKSVRNQDGSGTFAQWFHGIITRRHSEDLLSPMPFGCFLIRVSESRFGYSLSFRVEDRVRHYMIDQLPNGKFNVVGESKVHRSLHDLVEFYQKNYLSNWTGYLTTPCGQIQGQCDFSDLLDQDPVYSADNEDYTYVDDSIPTSADPVQKPHLYIDLEDDPAHPAVDPDLAMQDPVVQRAPSLYPSLSTLKYREFGCRTLRNMVPPHPKGPAPSIPPDYIRHDSQISGDSLPPPLPNRNYSIPRFSKDSRGSEHAYEAINTPNR